jgi:hypothetical protein
MKIDIGPFEPMANAERRRCDTEAVNKLAEQIFRIVETSGLSWRDVGMALATVHASVIRGLSDGKVDERAITLPPAVVCLWTAAILRNSVLN